MSLGSTSSTHSPSPASSTTASAESVHPLVSQTVESKDRPASPSTDYSSDATTNVRNDLSINDLLGFFNTFTNFISEERYNPAFSCLYC
jgi:hypothetical protein